MRFLRPVVWKRAGVSTAILISALSCIAPNAHAEPQLILWSWERPDDLRMVSTVNFEVAFLVATLKLHGTKVNVVPRRQPLRMNSDVRKTAVVRIEVDDARKPIGKTDEDPHKTLGKEQATKGVHTTLGEEQATKAVQAILQAVHNLKISRVQIDFDARENERDFYKLLLKKLRESLPPHLELSMTALASWCLGDHWISDLPVSEKVPMVFRLGVDHDKIARDLAAGKQFCPDCSKAVGISIDEPALAQQMMRGLRTSRASPDRVYVFNPKPWNKSAVQMLLKLIRAD